MEKRIYSSWAFTENHQEKAKINCEIYEELKTKAQVVYRWQLEGMSQEALEQLKQEKSLLLDYKHGYGHTKYQILSNPHAFSMTQLALVADGGNLCFGYRMEGSLICIHTD